MNGNLPVLHNRQSPEKAIFDFAKFTSCKTTFSVTMTV